MDKQQEALIKAVVSDFTKEKGKQPKDEKELTEYIKEKGGDKYLQSKLEGLARKAQRGAKLNYIRHLSHKCAEDEELVYFKKGGRVGCGCKKKEDGGKVKLQDMPWKAEFKAKQAKKKAEEEARKKAEEAKRKMEEARRKREMQFVDDYNEGYSHVEKNKGINKNCSGTKIKIK